MVFDPHRTAAASNRTGPDRGLERHANPHEPASFEDDTDAFADFDCQTCGACCSYSSEWPRFTMETDEALDLIPARFVADDLRGMRCVGEQCSALSGRVGEKTACMIYEVRPDVCRECSPGDEACRMARAAYGMD